MVWRNAVRETDFLDVSDVGEWIVAFLKRFQIVR